MFELRSHADFRHLSKTLIAAFITASSTINVPGKQRKRIDLHQLGCKSVLTVYRVFAIVALYAVLVGVLAYAFVMGFYALNKSWAAPAILSAFDEKGLDYMSKLVTSRQTIEDLKVDVTHLDANLAEMKKHRAALAALDPALQKAIDRERGHDYVTGPQLAELEAQKQADNTKTQALLAQMHEVETRIKSDLSNGLITKGDAEQQLVVLNQEETAYTDSRIAGVIVSTFCSVPIGFLA